MATVQVYSSLDMSNPSVWYGLLESYDSHQITISAGSLSSQYLGNFSFDIYGNVFGQLLGYLSRENGITTVSVTGLNVDAHAAMLLIDSGQAEALYTMALDGSDILSGAALADVLLGYSGNDTIFGNGGADQLFGGTGSDQLDGGAGNDLLNGGDGIDTAQFMGATAATVNLALTGAQDTGYGLDTLVSIENLTSGDGNDRLNGNDLANLLSGGAGNDTLSGGAGNDSLYGGDGDDRLLGEDGNDQIWGGAGNDVLGGGANAGNDSLYGEDGNDRLWGGAGDDLLGGGAGAGNDSLYGEAGNDRLWGGGDADFLQGGAGNDSMYGEAGDDRLQGDAGDDLMNGGAGIDTAVFTGVVATSVNLGLAAGAGQNTGHGIDRLAYIENVVTGTGADILRGNAVANMLSSNGGNDQLYGQGGNDSLYGGGGNDRLFGGDGDDVLKGNTGDDLLGGGAGADRIVGGLGSDRLYGGTGADVFVFNSAAEIGSAASRDTVADFVSGQDQIDLSAMSLSFIGSAGFSHTAGELRFVSNATGGFLLGDTDGDGAADFVLFLQGVSTISAGDVIL